MSSNKPTITNHYVSKVFLKSWLRFNKSYNKEVLQAFIISKQDFEITGKNVYFAAEDCLYSINDENNFIDDSFESYLFSGENAWGELLVNIKKKGIVGFKDLHHFDDCLFFMVALSQRSKHRILAYERLITSLDNSMSSMEAKRCVLNIVKDSIESRANELANRKIHLIEFPNDVLYINESPFLDLKTSIIKKDEAMIALSPRLLLHFTSEILEEPKMIFTKLPVENKNSIKDIWNKFVIENAREWVVSIYDENLKPYIQNQLSTANLKKRQVTDKVMIILDGEKHEWPIIYE